MKDFIEKGQDIPENLYGNCYKDISLCFICQHKYDEYKKNPFCIWDKLPTDCKLSGWIFLKQEAVKQKIRRKKEKILSLKIKLKNSDGFKEKRILRDIEKYQKEIDTYKKYGSDNW